MTILAGMLWVSAVLLPVGLAGGGELQGTVFNGSFEQDRDGDGVPDGWAAFGRADIKQRLTLCEDAERGHAARLECTSFAAGYPDSHVMLAQLDHAGVKAAQWYRLRLWARGQNLESTAVQVALVDRRQWRNSGLLESFIPGETWEQFEFSFRASEEVKPEDSRLQIWFAGTGVLYVDDVSLEPIAPVRRQWHPQLDWPAAANPLGNSGFECGGAGWGCWGGGLPGWGGEIYRLMGEWGGERAFEGRHSWRLSLSPQTLPVYYFDYFDPVEHPVKAVLVGHLGWVPLEPGQSYVFSGYVTADRPNLTVRIVCRQADGRRLDRTVSVGQEWSRVHLAFTAEADFACGFIGLDLAKADKPEGTLWLDALQWERGTEPSAYRPREALEARVETDRPGNVFTDPQAGLALRLRAYNAKDTDETLCGTLTLTDYLDQPVWRQEVKEPVKSKQAATVEYDRIMAGRRGFFRLQWTPQQGVAQTLRLAVIEPSPEPDSVFGMNHAFSWEFLLGQSHLAGVRWWRDWSAKWHTVQPQPGAFSFDVPDAQIERVLEAKGQVLVLLPFPSAPWATRPDEEKVKTHAGNDRYLRERLVVACKPERLEDFAGYVRATVGHYKTRIKAFEVLNEPLYTTYALPGVFGYTTADYVALLRTAYEAAKAVDPACIVVGGIGSAPDSKWVREFIEQGGLRWCDVMDLHLYPHRGAPDSYEKAFEDCRQAMAAAGYARPAWVTEIGCYGDDDPAVTPPTAGDSSMNASLRPNELRASADLVKFAAIFCAAGVRKVFYHAGTCAALNENDAGNIFFEYGGAPRKQFAAQAVLSRMLGPDVDFIRKWTEPQGVQAFEFRSRGRTVVMVWARRRGVESVKIPPGFRALDLMGNPLAGPEIAPTETPMYLVRQ